MLVKTFGSAVYGVEALTITVEVNVTDGKFFYLVGLPDNAVKESEQRIESTLKNSGYYMPRIKIIVNLAPADIKKTGTAFDLPACYPRRQRAATQCRTAFRICNHGRAELRWKYSAHQGCIAHCHYGG